MNMANCSACRLFSFAACRRSIACAMFMVWAAALLLPASVWATPTNGLSTAEIKGRELARELCDAGPAQDFTNTGELKIRDENGHLTTPKVVVETTSSNRSWTTRYIATLNQGKAHYQYVLTVTHYRGQPNTYHLTENTPTGRMDKHLSGNATMIPFAGSDFWVADLGLQFFHWPDQKIMPKTTELKRGRSYTLLQSINPNPSTNGYSRVLSWIDRKTGGILEAEAYDAKGKLLKDFEPKSFKKINGQWELQEMEIDNDQTGSRTKMEFDLGHD